MDAKPKLILLVDDEEAILSGLQPVFVRGGFATATARNGQIALDMLNQLEPDLIVLDVMMPVMDGYEAARRIRRRPNYIPIIMLTAKDETDDKVTGLELGADDYLTKPFEPLELLARVKATLRLAEQSRNRQNEASTNRKLISNGPLALDKDNKRILLRGVELNLPPKEYALLSVFIENPERVYGRETLLREVWGYDYMGDSRTVDMTVQRIRAKIETDPANPQFLLTIRGFGYRMADLPDKNDPT